MSSSNATGKYTTTLQWRIENFSFWNQEIHGKKLTSPQFVCSSFKGNNLCLVLFPNGFDGKDKYLRVRLHPVRMLLPATLDCEVSFLGSNGSPLATLVEKDQVLKHDTPLDFQPGPTYLEVAVTQKSRFLPRETLTLRCKVTTSNGDVKVNEYYFARTRIVTRETIFVWPKQCFSKLELDKSVTTSLLLTRFPQDFVSVSWKQTLKGPTLENSRLVFEIGKVACKETMLLRCRISLMDRFHKPVTFKEAYCMFEFPPTFLSWCLPPFLRQELLATSIEDLSLSIVVVTSLISETIESTIRTPGFSKYTHRDSLKACQNGPSMNDVMQYKIDSTTALVESIFNLYLDHSLSDFEVQSEGISFPVHKNILCTRSPVFNALLTNKNYCNSMKINDVDASTLNRMLRFIYGGSLNNLNWELAVKLYSAAHTYQIQSLQQECFCTLQYSIDASNVHKILTLADRHDDKELLSIVYDFIYNNFDEVVLSKEWKLLEDNEGKLASKTLKTIYEIYSSEDTSSSE